MTRVSHALLTATVAELVTSGYLTRSEANAAKEADRQQTREARQALARFRAEWQATRRPAIA